MFRGLGSFSTQPLQFNFGLESYRHDVACVCFILCVFFFEKGTYTTYMSTNNTNIRNQEPPNVVLWFYRSVTFHATKTKEKYVENAQMGDFLWLPPKLLIYH